jgi:hypothetical protein
MSMFYFDYSCVHMESKRTRIHILYVCVCIESLPKHKHQSSSLRSAKTAINPYAQRTFADPNNSNNVRPMRHRM